MQSLRPTHFHWISFRLNCFAFQPIKFQSSQQMKKKQQQEKQHSMKERLYRVAINEMATLNSFSFLFFFVSSLLPSQQETFQAKSLFLFLDFFFFFVHFPQSPHSFLRLDFSCSIFLAKKQKTKNELAPMIRRLTFVDEIVFHRIELATK